jgi:hypothetical protein
MAKFLHFFPRQTLIAGSAATVYYSNVFEIADCAQVYHELKLYAGSGLAAANVSGTMEHSDDPSFASPTTDSFTTYGSSLTVSGDPVSGVAVTSTGLITTTPKRFIRAKVTVPGTGKIAVISYVARGFC